MTEGDAIAPDRHFLGVALADHWAIGTPFENNPALTGFLVNHNHFPRAAMIESLLRFVVADIQAKNGGAAH